MVKRAVIGLIGVALAASACVGPSRTDADYTSKALHTVDVVRSSLQTVQLAIDVIDHGGGYRPYLSRLIGNVEDDANAAVNSFEVVQPPSTTADGVRSELGDAVDPGIDVLSAARIAIRRSDPDAVVALEPDLHAALDQLDRFEASVG
jgi:hypothetical protein